MRAPDWLKLGEDHVWRPYCQHKTASDPIPVVETQGARLRLPDGRELVDGIASWWTAAHGYNHPHIAARVREQLEVLPHVAFGGLAHEAGYTLAKRLAGLLPEELDHVFLVESGSVAVEVGLKIALQAAFHRGEGHRRKVIAFEGAYHGDTFATMALCDPVDGMHRAFTGLGVEAVHLPVPKEGDDFEGRFAEHASTAACAIIEPLVQCAGGMRFHSPEALQRLRRACDTHGIPLVFDEIATGFFRTGAIFALERAGVVPDIVVLGKALTGGTLPLAATVAKRELFEAFWDDDPLKALQHGPTYMANPLACAAAHGSLDLFEKEDMAERVARLEARLEEGLAPLRDRPGVRDVRVLGAVGAVEMEPGTAPASDAFAKRGAFIRPLRLRSADVAYLMPPLTIPDEDLELLFSALAATL